MKRLLSLVLVVSMLFAFVIPAAANPDKNNGNVPASETYGAVAEAKILKQTGNTNLISITVKVTDNKGRSITAAYGTFELKKNSAATFEVGAYTVYVNTYGNDKIDVSLINEVSEMLIPDEEIPEDVSVSGTGVLQPDGNLKVFLSITKNGIINAFGSVLMAKNSSEVFKIGGYDVFVSTYDEKHIYAVLTNIEETEPVPEPESSTYLVQNITSQANINYGGDQQQSGRLGTHTVYWDNGGSSNNPNGTSRFIQFTVNVPAEGLYKLDFRWFTRGDNSRRMKINSELYEILYFTRKDINTWENNVIYRPLQAGENTIRIWYHNSGTERPMDPWLFIDSLKVTAYDGTAERNTFWNDFANVLTLNVNTLNITDADGINAALAAYENLTYVAKTLLENEKSLLDALKAGVTELEKGRDEILNNFGFADVLSKSITSLKITDAGRLYAALAAFAALPEYSKTLLVAEKSLLDVLAVRMALLEKGDTVTVMLEDWLNAYLKDRGNGVYSTYLWSDKSSSGEETGFWQAANVYEVFNDYYEYTTDPAEKELFKKYMDGYRTRFLDGSFSWSGTWKNNEYTDDLLWWSNAFIRTYTLTGDESYLAVGEEIFKHLYVRAWDTREISDAHYYSGVQGGLLWKFNKSSNWDGSYPNDSNNSNEKNIATNGNGTIAAARLARIYAAKGDIVTSGYYADVAKGIYDWMRASMVADYNTGKIWDNFQSQAGKNGPRDWQFSYNYGLFGGAAYEMWVNTGDDSYLADAKLVLNYGWATLTLDDELTFKMEGGMDGGDGASFRLVFARYTGLVVKSPEFAEFGKYMLANAYQTWNFRRSGDGLVGESSIFETDSATRIPSPIAAYGVLMQIYSDFNPNITYGFENGLTKWKTGYKTFAEAAGDKTVRFDTHFIKGGNGFGANEGPSYLFDYTSLENAGTNTKYGGGVPYWAEWNYDNAFIASRLIIATANDNMSWNRRMGDGWTLSGSDDGVNWNIIYIGKADDYSNFNNTFYSFDLTDNTAAYSYYKLNSETGGDGTTVQLSVVALAAD
ncbi:glycoside hydrolase family 76 protein [Paenibacillus spongiae]|uniref:CBM6 domain-containing protein n=1 Tax=Paenibacillus spongiae TaxID=2909671 RepID=A0ABY5SL81_9BACL|nr:glycoside hydrolase family 76 protein [Paenibacillus spongiae]UVI33333.1 hypothetical protein L1F29_16465 [Paenibacillus spongiae]